ncbi:hypothetical protein Pcinc_014625 [Petrolisthes cinctipes]|uniref:THAP-type domain-containing protein n=1 Tax=Petrolisthes cinctipes TaxID=88211 RepID=A0AAE1FW71_PETCI|nr:hypothetical protein Pcinc_014625 [Petrolisthes cinctipes]
MHRFPRDTQRRKVWAIKVKRKDWSPNNNSFLCSDHFDDGQYESERADNLRKLKPNAVPTLFAYQKVPPKFRKPPRKRGSSSTENSKPCSPTKKIQLEHGYAMVNFDARALQINLAKNTDDENDEDVDNHDQDMPDDSPDQRGPLMETTVSVLNTSLERKVKRQEASNARLKNDEDVGNYNQDMPDDSPDERGPLMETTVLVLNTSVERKVKRQEASDALLKNDEGVGNHDQDMPDDDSPDERGPLMETTVSVLNTSLERKVKRQEASNAQLKNDEGIGNHNQVMPDDSPDERGPLMETTVSILNISLERKVKRQEASIARLKKALAKERRMKRKILKEKMSLEGKLCKVFSPNQLLHLGRVKCKGVKWSNDVIKKGLQLRNACGAGGYQLLLSQGQPLPSMRSLRRKMEVVLMEPDI